MSRIGLALGAGGARGFAHLHALRAFDDLGVKPAVVAGTSMGALIGAAYCSGMSAGNITAYVHARLDDRLRLLGEVFKIAPTSVQSFLDEGGLRLGELNLERILEVFLPSGIGATFEDLSLPFRVVAADYYGERSMVFTDGPLRPCLAASACMPAIFRPVRIDGVYCFDGSATNPCPVDAAQEDSTHVIGVDVAGGSYGDPNEKPGMVDAAYAANQMMQATMAKLSAQQFSNTVLLRAPVNRFRPLDFLKAREILAESAPLYDETKRTIDRIMSADGDQA